MQMKEDLEKFVEGYIKFGMQSRVDIIKLYGSIIDLKNQDFFIQVKKIFLPYVLRTIGFDCVKFFSDNYSFLKDVDLLIGGNQFWLSQNMNGNFDNKIFLSYRILTAQSKTYNPISLKLKEDKIDMCICKILL